MIAQYLALDHHEMVQKLILTVTSSRPNPILTVSITEWRSYAQSGDHTGLMDSNLRKIYSENYYRKNKWLVPIMGKLTKPKSYHRFYIQAKACLTHDVYESLPKIKAPTFVIGGLQDQALGSDASKEIAERIPNAQLLMYEQWGHGLYEEAKDFNKRVLDYLTLG
jgi:pimeloyl-ACP methyl ester carboxylesterase